MKKPSFDGIAPHYWWLERISFAHWLQQTRTALLSEIGDRRNVLIVGDGDGRFLQAFLRANNQARVDSLDISPRMVEIAKARIRLIPGALERVAFLVDDALCHEFNPSSYDLVVTNFFLDCFTAVELPGLISRLARTVSQGGKWLVGDFHLPAKGLERLLARIALGGMYGFFKALTGISAGRLVDPAPWLEANGFISEQTVTRLGSFLKSTLWTLERPAVKPPGSPRFL